MSCEYPLCSLPDTPSLQTLYQLRLQDVHFNTFCLLPLLLSRFSRVWLCVTPQTAAHQAPPSLGFSRQEHWSALPFPSPMHESEKWKWSHWVMSNSQRPRGLQPTRLLRPWDFPGKSTGVGCHCLLRANTSETISCVRKRSTFVTSLKSHNHCGGSTLLTVS